MKIIQDKYRLVKEGKITKKDFIRESSKLFPNYITNYATFEEVEKILKQHSIINEDITKETFKEIDWFKVFNEGIKINEQISMNRIRLSDEEVDNLYNTFPEIEDPYYPKKVIDTQGEMVTSKLEIDGDNYIVVSDPYEGDIWYLEGHLKNPKSNIFEGSKKLQNTKAIEKKTSKEVINTQSKAYDKEDDKNLDNVYGQEFLVGFRAEMGDPKNSEKTIEQLEVIVAKNLRKDRLYYVKDGQFGVKGIGYTDEAPGLKASKSDQMDKVKINENLELGGDETNILDDAIADMSKYMSKEEIKRYLQNLLTDTDIGNLESNYIAYNAGGNEWEIEKYSQ